VISRRLAVAAVAAATILPAWGPAPAQPTRPTWVSAAPAKKVPRGELRIRVTGLPSGVRPVVRIAGPGQYRKTVKRTRTLRKLRPGVYRVVSPRVSTAAGSAKAKTRKQRVQVRAGRTAKVKAAYTWKTPPPPPDTTAPGQVSALSATDRTPETITLAWTNPTDPDLAEIVVRRAKGDTAPATPTDGTGVTPGTPTGLTDTGLDPDTTYSYAVFTRDTTGNTSSPATLTTATTTPPKVYSVFNHPTPGQDGPEIRTELVGLLEQVPAGAKVEASFFIILPNYPVVDALIAAHHRGADVRVVLDSGDRQGDATNASMDATFERLRVELGGDTSAASFAMQCDRACISQEEDSIQHNKFVLMSESGNLTDVVFETTSNMRTGGSGDATWNAAVVSSGNPGVYDSFRGYFADLAARRSVPGNDYHAFRPPVTHGELTPYYFPRTDGTDTVAQGLAGVDCSTGPTVDVMAAHFVRTAVRDRLNEMAQAGCGVRVISRADNISRELCDSLVAGSVLVRIGAEPSASAVGIHAKYLTITGGADDQHLVWMGSHNLTDNALLRNDETFLLIDDQPVHDTFTDNFETIWDDPAMTPGCATVLQ